MFHELAFLACTFFVTGAICLGGALYNLPRPHLGHLLEALSETQLDVANLRDGFHNNTVAIARLDQDLGEARGRANFLDKKYQAVADDFYRHLSLNAQKKTRGHQ
jgi:hypothetical protein